MSEITIAAAMWLARRGGSIVTHKPALCFGSGDDQAQRAAQLSNGWRILFTRTNGSRPEIPRGVRVLNKAAITTLSASTVKP